MVNQPRVFAGLLMLLLIMFAFAPTASASAYNITIDSNKIYSKQWCIVPPFLTTPLDPKVACNTDGTQCIALVYDTCTSSGVRILWSVDQFETHVQVAGTMSGSLGSEYLDYYNTRGKELPYDVEYFEDQRAFYMIYKDDIFVGFTEDLDGAGGQTVLPHVYTPSAPLITPLQTYGETVTFDCAVETTFLGGGHTCSGSSEIISGYKFQDGNATNLWGIQACRTYKSSPVDVAGIFCEWTYDVTNTTATRLNMVNLFGSIFVSCTAPPTGWNVDNISAQAFWSGTDWKYDIEGIIDFCDTGELNQDVSIDTLPSLQDDWNQHYFGGNLYWKNFTAPYVNGSILKSATSDFTSYGSISTVYTEDGSVNESINQSDSDYAGTTSLYIWERNSGSDVGNDGIWISREDVYEIIISADTEHPVSASLYCNDSGSDYYYSGSGEWFSLFTPCQTDNRIIFTSQDRPTTHIEWFDIDSSCTTDGLDVSVYYADTPFNHTFSVRTEGNLPISGANITIAGEGTETTDVNGEAIFELQPLAGSTLYRNNYSTCDIRMSTDGTPSIESYDVEYAGFIDEAGTIPAPTKSTIGGYYVWSFNYTTDVVLYESGMYLDISLVAGSGVDVSPCNYEVNVSGADYIAIMFSGVPNLGNSWNTFPIEFKINHSFEPVNVTLDLTLPNGSHIIEYHNLSYDESDTHVFYLPFSIDDLICTEDCDCPDSICIGKYFYDGVTNLCGTDNTCDYEISNCQLSTFCDDLIGCFNADTLLECSGDVDCPDSCVDSNTMIWGRCGSDNLCKNITYECATECNQTAGICEEMRTCEYGDDLDYKVFYYQGGVQSNLLSGTYTCDMSNVGEKTCLGDGTENNAVPLLQLVDLGLTIGNVYVTPDDLSYSTSADNLYYNFSDISVYCNDTCEIQYEICGGNCDPSTGECVDSLGTIENVLKSFLPEWLKWLLTSTFLWSLFCLVIGAILTFLPAIKSNHAQPTPEYGLASMFVMFIVGLFLGFVEPIIGLIIIIGLGLALTKVLSNMLGGN